MPPAKLAGVTAFTCVDEITTTPVANVVPNDTDVVVSKFVPVIVTDVPPSVVPTFGVILVMLGPDA